MDMLGGYDVINLSKDQKDQFDKLVVPVNNKIWKTHINTVLAILDLNKMNLAKKIGLIEIAVGKKQYCNIVHRRNNYHPCNRLQTKRRVESNSPHKIDSERCDEIYY